MGKKNNIYTLGYFRKRLQDSGYHVKTVVNEFRNKEDPRKWMVSVLNEKTDYPVFCMCIDDEANSGYLFKLFDGNVRTYNTTIKTDSMNVIIKHLEGVI